MDFRPEVAMSTEKSADDGCDQNATALALMEKQAYMNTTMDGKDRYSPEERRYRSMKQARAPKG